MLHQKMVQYSIASGRSTDGAENRIILDGKNGYIGWSKVYLKYLEDGYISIAGTNQTEYDGWKALSEFALEPGTYTLTGMKVSEPNTLALQLRISDDTGFFQYLYQWNADITFTVNRNTKAALHVRVYPMTDQKEEILARPAVYRDE